MTHDVRSYAPPSAARAGVPARDPLALSVTAIVLLTLLLILSINDGTDPDLWGHVRYAEDLLAGHALPVTPPYTFTAADRPWVNHEYLAGLVFAIVARLGGDPGLPVLKSLLGLALFGLMLGAAKRRHCPLPIIAVIMPLVAYNLLPWWTVRPQLFTYVLFTTMIVVLDRAQTSRRVFFVIPALFVVWANLHGGAVAGWCFCTLYLGCRSLEALRARGSAAWGDVRLFALVCLAAALAILLTPYGLAMPRWVVRVIGEPRLEITEWETMSVTHPYFPGWAALVAVIAFGLLGDWRAFGFTRSGMIAVALWQSYLHTRHTPFLTILVGLWLPGQLAITWRRSRAAPAGEPPMASSGAVRVARAIAWTIAILLLGTLVVRNRALWVGKGAYPVEALDYMAAHRLVGRSVVHFNWALYTIAAFAPATSVSIDGRLDFYPQEIIDMNLDFFLGEIPGRSVPSGAVPRDHARVLEYGRPDLALLDRRFPHAIEVISAQSGWVMLYQDGLAQLWGRREKYDFEGGADYLPPADRSVSERSQSGSVPWPALPERRGAS